MMVCLYGSQMKFKSSVGVETEISICSFYKAIKICIDYFYSVFFFVPVFELYSFGNYEL